MGRNVIEHSFVFSAMSVYASQAQILFENAAYKIQRYNRSCLHYNLAADAVYQERQKSKAPFSPTYESYLVAALVSFGMGRMMGKGLVQRYDVTVDGFAARLHKKLAKVQQCLGPIIESSLIAFDLGEHVSEVTAAYTALAIGGEEALNEQGKEFHVGTTKILHFLNPELFPIVDSNAAEVLRRICGLPYRNTTQPGYSSELYIKSLSVIRNLIVDYGINRFRTLEIGTPLLRIFDKIVFAFNALAV